MLLSTLRTLPRAARQLSTKAATPAGQRGLAVGAGAFCAGVVGLSYMSTPTVSCERKTIHSMLEEILNRLSVVDGAVGVQADVRYAEYA